MASLSRLMAAGVHPLHYHCLEAYCLLTSACRAAACTGSGNGAVTCAAAYALSSALAVDHLVRAGNRHAMPFKRWHFCKSVPDSCLIGGNLARRVKQCN